VTREEALRQIEDMWRADGECGSCGWHAAFYEVREQVLQNVEDGDVSEHPKWGKYLRVGCMNSDEGFPSDHRGTKVYLNDELCDALKR
jgi:hypothetical protein